MSSIDYVNYPINISGSMFAFGSWFGLFQRKRLGDTTLSRHMSWIGCERLKRTSSSIFIRPIGDRSFTVKAVPAELTIITKQNIRFTFASKTMMIAEEIRHRTPVRKDRW